VVLLIGILLFFELGRWVGRRERETGIPTGIGSLEAAVFGLLGLMIAFTFGGAAQRWEKRRDLVVQETNAIGTAYLRLDLLEPNDRDTLRELFKEYVGSRLAVYQRLPYVDAALRELEHADHQQQVIWSTVVKACRKDSSGTNTRMLLPAVNDMIDITTTRTRSAFSHPPAIIFILLYLLAMAASMIAGHGMAKDEKRRWLHQIGYAIMMAGSVYVILEIEYPRLGFVQMSDADQALVELLASWTK
jgi:hypothetical protein